MMREIFQLKSNTWVLHSFGCKHCDITFKTERYCLKHEESCKAINTLKKQKEESDMLIQRITKGDQSFYRQGNDGKLYKTKAEAESKAKEEKK